MCDSQSCDSATGLCRLNAVGEECREDNDCEPQLECEFKSEEGSFSCSAPTNEKCGDHDHCHDGHMCHNGECLRKNGEECAAHDECLDNNCPSSASGTFCIGKAGGSCSRDDDCGGYFTGYRSPHGQHKHSPGTCTHIPELGRKVCLGSEGDACGTDDDCVEGKLSR